MGFKDLLETISQGKANLNSQFGADRSVKALKPGRGLAREIKSQKSKPTAVLPSTSPIKPRTSDMGGTIPRSPNMNMPIQPIVGPSAPQNNGSVPQIPTPIPRTPTGQGSRRNIRRGLSSKIAMNSPQRQDSLAKTKLATLYGSNKSPLPPRNVRKVNNGRRNY